MRTLRRKLKNGLTETDSFSVANPRKKTKRAVAMKSFAVLVLFGGSFQAVALDARAQETAVSYPNGSN